MAHPKKSQATSPSAAPASPAKAVGAAAEAVLTMRRGLLLLRSLSLSDADIAPDAIGMVCEAMEADWTRALNAAIEARRAMRIAAE